MLDTSLQTLDLGIMATVRELYMCSPLWSEPGVLFSTQSVNTAA